MVKVGAKVDGLELFKARFDKTYRVVEKAMEDQLNEDADHYVEEMKGTVAVESGRLQGTIRKRKAGKLAVQILAGGSATRSSGSGKKKGYDYARAVEFGTVNMSAQPFFYVTARKLKKWHKDQMKNAVKDAIKEANEE